MNNFFKMYYHFKNKEKFIGQEIVLVITGGNVDLVTLPWLEVGKD